jgi:hypothetical protein
MLSVANESRTLAKDDMLKLLIISAKIVMLPNFKISCAVVTLSSKSIWVRFYIIEMLS